MAGHQKIYPAPLQPVGDLESQQKATAPLVRTGSSKSHNGSAVDSFPPYHRTIPIQHSKPPKKRGCCRRWLRWILCFLILLVVSVGILAAIVYFGFDQKVPKYTVDGMAVTRFGLDNDSSLYAQFNINITARNPNTKIGIYYEGGSKLSVVYMGTNLCEGSFPKFYQGHKNTTVLDVALTGRTRDATVMNLLQAQQQTGTVPPVLRVRVPVRIKLGKLKLPKWNQW